MDLKCSLGLTYMCLFILLIMEAKNKGMIENNSCFQEKVIYLQEEYAIKHVVSNTIIQDNRLYNEENSCVR